MPNQCKHYYVSGRVQGVFYRASTQVKARELNLTGWVKNLSDGRVEVVVCGEEENIEKLTTWLWDGPPAAHVEEVIVSDHPVETFSDFEHR